MTHCLCVSEREKAKGREKKNAHRGERREMPAVCTICTKHMVGREGHVEGCVCVYVCVSLASFKKVFNTLTFGEGMFI